MALQKITKQFALINDQEKQLNYRFEPRYIKEKSNWKRDNNYKEFKEDFMNELTMFGFSPFIQKSFKDQREDPNIMKYKPRVFNQRTIDILSKKKINKKQLKKSISIPFIIKSSDDTDSTSGKLSSMLKCLQAQSVRRMQSSTNSFTEEKPLKKNENIESSASDLLLLNSKKEKIGTNCKRVIFDKLMGVNEKSLGFANKLKRFTFREKLNQFMISNIHKYNHSMDSISSHNNRKTIRPTICGFEDEELALKFPYLQRIGNMNKPDNSITKMRTIGKKQQTIFNIALKPTNID